MNTANDRRDSVQTSRAQLWLQRLIAARPAIVRISEAVAPQFRLITIQGQALRGLSWKPGQHIDLIFPGWIKRSYTPLDFDTEQGVTQILIYLQAGGPGAKWATSVTAGEPCSVVGPRSSLDLTGLQRPAIFFGDETTLGLAAALKKTADLDRGVKFILECNSRPESNEVCARLELSDFELYQRDPHDAHLVELESRIHQLAGEVGAVQFILSGRSQAIKHIGKALKARGRVFTNLSMHPYWTSKAVGKVGPSNANGR